MRTRSIASSANASHLENDPRRSRKVSPAGPDITKQSGDVSNVSFMYSSVFLRVEGRANTDRVDCSIDAVKNCGRDVENGPNSIENEMLLRNKGAIGAEYSQSKRLHDSLPSTASPRASLRAWNSRSLVLHFRVVADYDANDVFQFT